MRSVGEIPLRPTGELDEVGDEVWRRTMTPAEVLERERLNAENTTERLRWRTLGAPADWPVGLAGLRCTCVARYAPSGGTHVESIDTTGCPMHGNGAR